MPPRLSSMCYGFVCDNGWFNLLKQLCEDLNELGMGDKLQVTSVKEKLGGLRFNFRLTQRVDGQRRSPCLWVSRIGSFCWKRVWLRSLIVWVRRQCTNLRIFIGGKTLHEKIRDLTMKARGDSYKICEICGSLGRLRANSVRIKTLCEPCRVIEGFEDIEVRNIKSIEVFTERNEKSDESSRQDRK